MIDTQLMETHVMPANFTPELLTKEQLRQKLNVPHVAIIDNLRKARKIPCVKLGYRTIRFSYPKVQAALERLTIKEIGG